MKPSLLRTVLNIGALVAVLLVNWLANALHQHEWYEQERPAPGSLTDRVVREGLVAEHRVSPLFGSTPLNRDAA